MKESFLGKTFKSLELPTRVVGSRFLSSTPDSLMEYLHSDKDLIDKVPIVDTPPVPETETGSQGNPTTPANNQGNRGGRRDGMATPTPNHHDPNSSTSSSCQTPYIEVLMEEDLQPTPPEEFSLGDETRNKEGDPPLSQEDTTLMEPHNLAKEDLGSPTPTSESVSTTNHEGNGENNIPVTQMVGDLQQEARTPIVNPYSSSS
eukprot:4990233-Ditylum_brightwellii.AAC.1